VWLASLRLSTPAHHRPPSSPPSLSSSPFTLCSVTACSALSALQARTVPSHQKPSGSGVTAQRQEPDLQPAEFIASRSQSRLPHFPQARQDVARHISDSHSSRAEIIKSSEVTVAPKETKLHAKSMTRHKHHRRQRTARTTVPQYIRDALARFGNRTFSASRRRSNGLGQCRLVIKTHRVLTAPAYMPASEDSIDIALHIRSCNVTRREIQAPSLRAVPCRRGRHEAQACMYCRKPRRDRNLISRQVVWVGDVTRGRPRRVIRSGARKGSLARFQVSSQALQKLMIECLLTLSRDCASGQTHTADHELHVTTIQIPAGGPTGQTRRATI